MESSEQDLFTIIGVIFGLLAACLFGIIILGTSQETATLLDAAGPMVITIAAIVALMNYRLVVQKSRREERIRKSKTYLDEARNILKQSFEFLMNKNPPHLTTGGLGYQQHDRFSPIKK